MTHAAGERFLVDNHAGWRLGLTRFVPEGTPVGRPVVVIPGYGMNSFIFRYHPTGPSMMTCRPFTAVKT